MKTINKSQAYEQYLEASNEDKYLKNIMNEIDSSSKKGNCVLYLDNNYLIELTESQVQYLKELDYAITEFNVNNVKKYIISWCS